MTQPTSIEDAIEQNAMGPASVSNPNVSVSQHSIQDQIAADRYLASKQAASSNVLGFGIRVQRIVPPGGG